MIGGLFLQTAQAGDLRIALPKGSTTTPVQQLNRDGVEAINKHNVAKAKKLFYQAYLLDPDDPFTLNNLGYISELEGAGDRAQKFYALAREQSVGAVVDKSSKANLRGKTVTQAAGMMDRDMQVNRANLEAMQLLQKNQVLDAEQQLQTALRVDPNNPFTLNNLGLVKEKEGDLQGALNSYQAASSRNSKEPAIVTQDQAAARSSHHRSLEPECSARETPAAGARPCREQDCAAELFRRFRNQSQRPRQCTAIL